MPVRPGPLTGMALARDQRAESDYVFDFWTAFGWTLLTFGVYTLYVVYQLVRRMRDHNRRRLAFLDAAYHDAWARSVAAGRDNEERPRFERIARELDVLRRLDAEFREPAIWLVLCLLANGIVQFVVLVLNDMDLIKHQAAEATIEHELGQLLGLPLPEPAPPKPQHNYVGRVIASIASCGIYMFWWLADVMREGNDHFRRDWAWEDTYLAAVR